MRDTNLNFQYLVVDLCERSGFGCCRASLSVSRRGSWGVKSTLELSEVMYPSSVESECVEFSTSVSGDLLAREYLWSINESRSVCRVLRS